LTGIYTAVVFLSAVGAALLLLVAWNHRGASRGPRIRVRRLPKIGGDAAEKAGSTITVAGRTYNVVDREKGTAPRSAPCPWCLRSVDATDPDAVVCRNPQCRRAAHRRCNKENEGCGGVCGVLG
jgi:hypothetical protein